MMNQTSDNKKKNNHVKIKQDCEQVTKTTIFFKKMFEEIGSGTYEYYDTIPAGIFKILLSHSKTNLGMIIDIVNKQKDCFPVNFENISSEIWNIFIQGTELVQGIIKRSKLRYLLSRNKLINLFSKKSDNSFVSEEMDIVCLNGNNYFFRMNQARKTMKMK